MRIIASNADTIDLCFQCLPSREEAEEEYGNLGDGPDGRGNCFDYDGLYDHPDYEDGIEYRCANCRKVLTSQNS